MWFKRIINSFFGIRKKNDLENDLKNVNLLKLINLFKELRDDVLPYIFQLAIKYILFVINDILIYRFVF